MKRKLRFEKAWSSGRTTNTVLRGHIHSVLCLTLVEKTLFTGKKKKINFFHFFCFTYGYLFSAFPLILRQVDEMPC